jgi:hypothetical protein
VGQLDSSPIDPTNDFDYGFDPMWCAHCKLAYKSAPPTFCLRCGSKLVAFTFVKCACEWPCNGRDRSNYTNNGCRCTKAVEANRTYHAALRAAK